MTSRRHQYKCAADPYRCVVSKNDQKSPNKICHPGGHNLLLAVCNDNKPCLSTSEAFYSQQCDRFKNGVVLALSKLPHFQQVAIPVHTPHHLTLNFIFSWSMTTTWNFVSWELPTDSCALHKTFWQHSLTLELSFRRQCSYSTFTDSSRASQSCLSTATRIVPLLQCIGDVTCFLSQLCSLNYLRYMPFYNSVDINEFHKSKCLRTCVQS